MNASKSNSVSLGVPFLFVLVAFAPASALASVRFGRPALSGNGCDSVSAFARVEGPSAELSFESFFASTGESSRCGAIFPLEVRGGIVRVEVRRSLWWSGFSPGLRPARVQSVGDFGGRPLEAWTFEPYLGGPERASKRDVVEVRACASSGYRGAARVETRVSAPVAPGASIDVSRMRIKARVISSRPCPP